MGLNLGWGGKFPCPICLVPLDEQSDLAKVHPLRTSETMQKELNDACGNRLAEDCEHHLKNFGLRNIDVCGCATP
jgi:hypothetical protein